MSKISLAITTYNNTAYIDNIIKQVKLGADNVDEVLICDDHSDWEFYALLTSIGSGLDKRARLIRNSSNYGPYLNKLKAVKACSHPNVILLDADNILNQHYYSVAKSAASFDEPDVMYLPVDIGWSWDFRKFQGMTFNSVESVWPWIDGLDMQIALNTGNYLVPRDKYVEIAEKGNCQYTEVFYLAYQWLKAENKIHFLKDFSYHHSYNVNGRYAKASKEHDDANKEIVRWIKGVVNV